MSYCSRPAKTKKTAYTTPAKKTVNPPAARDEACGAASSTVVTGGGSSTSTTISVPGPAGPAGPRGWGFEWKNDWTIGEQYYAQSDDHPLASVVNYEGQSWVATTDNISVSTGSPEHVPGVSSVWTLMAAQGRGFEWKGQFALNVQYYAQSAEHLASVVEYAGSTYIAVADNISVTEDPPEYEPGVSSSWALVAQAGATSLTGEDKDFFDSLKDDVFDWWDNATLTDILLAGAIAAGVIWAGSEIVDMMSDSGEGDGEADSRYSGSDGYVSAGYTAPDIKVVLGALCDFAGVPYDASALPDEECMFVIGNNTSIRNIIDQLSLAYQFEMVDTAGVFKFVPRTATAVKTLTDADIGFDKNPVPPARYTAKRFQGIDLPRSITLQYYAEDTDYNTMTQSSQLFTFTEGQDINLSVPVTMTHAKAKQVTEIALIQSHVERMQYKFTVNYNSIELEPGDVVTTPMGTLRITKINELDEGLLEIEATDAGVAEAINTSDLEVAIPPASTNIPISLGYSQAFFIDPPNVNDADATVRIYAAVHGYDRAGWPGAQLWVSEDNGNTYSNVTSTSAEATVGLVATAPASADYLVWDETTTISVVLKTNSLVSKSELAVLNGENWCMIGQEIIGFKNAVLTAPKTYTLSGLLRGRQGTEQFVGTHSANELFVLLDSALLKVEWPTGDRGTTKKYKVVTIGSSLDKVDAQDVQMMSNNMRLWTVKDAAIQKLGNDFRLTYKERVRFNNSLLDGAEITHDPDWAGFGIVIYNAAETAVVKTYTTTAELFTYTEAMQIADFGSAQANVKTRVTQLSQNGAPGYPVTLNY